MNLQINSAQKTWQNAYLRHNEADSPKDHFFKTHSVKMISVLAKVFAESMKLYLKNHWANSKHVCTLSNSIISWIQMWQLELE